MDPKECKILFYSEDGQRYRLFVEGKEILSTRGITINASNSEITLTPHIVMSPCRVFEDGEPIFVIDDE